jgi:hypothetical protein
MPRFWNWAVLLTVYSCWTTSSFSAMKRTGLLIIKCCLSPLDYRGRDGSAVWQSMHAQQDAFLCPWGLVYSLCNRAEGASLSVANKAVTSSFQSHYNIVNVPMVFYAGRKLITYIHTYIHTLHTIHTYINVHQPVGKYRKIFPSIITIYL